MRPFFFLSIHHNKYSIRSFNVEILFELSKLKKSIGIGLLADIKKLKIKTLNNTLSLT